MKAKTTISMVFEEEVDGGSEKAIEHMIENDVLDIDALEDSFEDNIREQIEEIASGDGLHIEKSFVDVDVVEEV